MQLTTLKERCEALRVQVHAVCHTYGRDPSTVEILPVTKYTGIETAAEALKYGFTHLGESRVQELITKHTALPHAQFELIGPLQSNKVKRAVEHAVRIQSVHTEKLLRSIQAAAAAQGKVQRILIQVNTLYDPAKSGVVPEQLLPLVATSLACSHIALEGFMTLPPPDPTLTESAFTLLAQLRTQVQDYFQRPFPVLSMGMTHDWPIAVRTGSTLIRIGSQLFQQRY